MHRLSAGACLLYTSAVYSDYTSLSICKDNIITLSAGIFNNGELMDDVSGITFWVDDSSVLELKKTGVADKRRYTCLLYTSRRPELNYKMLAEVDPKRPKLPEDVQEQVNINTVSYTHLDVYKRQHLLCKINVDFTFFKVCVCNDFVESAFQLTDVRFNIGSDVFDHIVADGIAV